MKKMLLLLSLIAAPAWAGDAATPAAVASPDPKMEAMQAAPVAVTRVVIEFKGDTTKNISALVADLEKDAVYQEAVCSTSHAKKGGKPAKITCAKASSGLMEFLLKNNPAKVRWSISATPMLLKACTPGCYFMNCPVTPKCCNVQTHQPC